MVEPLRAARKSNFGWRLGDADEADQLDLIIGVEGPAQELEFRVGSAADVEDPIRPAALVDDHQPAVIGRGLLARCRVAARFTGPRLLVPGEGADAVEAESLLLGPELESEGERLVVAA